MNDENLLYAVIEAIKDSNAHKIVCKEIYISKSLREELLRWEDLKRAEHVNSLTADNDSKQAQIDALMLEYCPDEMTPEQLENWGKHQVAATGWEISDD